MKQKIMALYDTDAVYAVHFTEYAVRRGSIPFEVHAFTDREALSAFVLEEKVELLLVSSQVMEREMLGWHIPKIVILSEEPAGSGTDPNGLPQVFKYQSQAEVIREVMAHYGQTVSAAEPKILMKPKMKTIGFCSPVGRCGKTSLALALGQILAGRKSTLYVNLEPFSGLSDAFPATAGGSLIDLLFCLRQEEGTGAARLSGMTVQLGGLDILPKGRPGRELFPADRSDWERFFRLVRNESGYESLILDIGCGLNDCLFCLSACDVIFMPVRSATGSAAKTEEFFRWLREQDADDVIERIRKLHLREVGEAGGSRYFQELPYTVYGGWAKELIRREGL